MHIAVIGAGTGGLCAAKHALANGFKVTVFEQTGEIGGTWVYTDDVGKTNNGMNIHTSMYHGLRTNFPKEIMGFMDFPITEPKESYIPSEDVLKFLKLYAETFDLLAYIKFHHCVIRVHPKLETKWELIVHDLVNDSADTLIFDAVMVCNGHFSTPILPNYPGQELFLGQQIHSHNYRRPEQFKGEDVLIVGAGTSGIEISHIIEPYAKTVTLSTHGRIDSKTQLPSNVKLRPDVAELTKNGAKFQDDTQDTFTKILYCTGYEYAFEFLSMNCGIKVEDNYVYPLYKHCINIERPTMIIVGLLARVSPSLVMDMQVRYFMKYLKGEMKLPSKEDMLNDTENKMQLKWNQGHKKRHSHIFFDDEQNNYFNDLAEEAGIEKIRPVVLKLYAENTKTRSENSANYRNHVFRIIDDETFTYLY